MPKRKPDAGASAPASAKRGAAPPSTGASAAAASSVPALAFRCEEETHDDETEGLLSYFNATLGTATARGAILLRDGNVGAHMRSACDVASAELLQLHVDLCSADKSGSALKPAVLTGPWWHDFVDDLGDVLHIETIVVPSADRRKGLATALIRRLLDHFKDCSLAVVMPGVANREGRDMSDADMEAALRRQLKLFHALGFRRLGRTMWMARAADPDASCHTLPPEDWYEAAFGAGANAAEQESSAIIAEEQDRGGGGAHGHRGGPRVAHTRARARACVAAAGGAPRRGAVRRRAAQQVPALVREERGL